MKVRKYKNYEDYIAFQSIKTNDPEKRKKWLGEEWDTKINGFKKEFEKFKHFLTSDKKCLCIGARTGQEIVALKDMGIENCTGIDIVPHSPHVIKGDMHNLNFDDDTFDFIYTNVIDHSINPALMISEIERVLKTNGIFFLQIQLGINQDEYTEFVINNPLYDLLTLFNMCFCVNITNIDMNFAGMNFDLIFQKDEKLSSVFKTYGNLDSLHVPENYKKIWNDINLPIQENKLNANNIYDNEKRDEVLNGLAKRAFYLTRFADVFESKNIVEVGTAEGWQYYSFIEYAKAKNSNIKVTSCDPRDVRNFNYLKKYLDDNDFNFIDGTSMELSKKVENVDFYYIDGSHDKGAILNDLLNLEKTQSKKKIPIWIFDDFDARFGSFEDLLRIIQACKAFKVYKVGITGSGNPNHQLLIKGKFEVNED